MDFLKIPVKDVAYKDVKILAFEYQQSWNSLKASFKVWATKNPDLLNFYTVHQTSGISNFIIPLLEEGNRRVNSAKSCNSRSFQPIFMLLILFYSDLSQIKLQALGMLNFITGGRMEGVNNESPLIKLLLIGGRKSEHVNPLFATRDDKGEYQMLIPDLSDNQQNLKLL
ncbi:hypothetical protein NQ318_010394 [Aromia moschata]|uniref:Uncharacterized protein n=1 Tax=Aromia moschata TaxID=1265417 RepID=A0AAV8Y744_9CUCU|nr:hypothetical protein NQ318_010394 [Aromia moschata]